MHIYPSKHTTQGKRKKIANTQYPTVSTPSSTSKPNQNALTKVANHQKPKHKPIERPTQTSPKQNREQSKLCSTINGGSDNTTKPKPLGRTVNSSFPHHHRLNHLAVVLADKELLLIRVHGGSSSKSLGKFFSFLFGEYTLGFVCLFVCSKHNFEKQSEQICMLLGF